MASEELARQDDYGLEERQVKALGRLSRLGAKPREKDEGYDSDPQIRALQLVYEGRMGGPGLKQGRPRTGVSTTEERERRAAEVIALEIRNRFTGKMIKALDRALRKDAGTKANLDAVKLALDIENREASLQLKEHESDFDTNTKAELLDTLFKLVAEPQTAAAIEGSSWEITDAEEVTEGSSAAGEPGHNGDSPNTVENGSHTGDAGPADRQRLAAHRAKSANPFTQTALRRANQR